MAEFDTDAVVRALEHASQETKAEVARMLLSAADDFERDWRRAATSYRRTSATTVVRRVGEASTSTRQSRHSRRALSLADGIRRIVKNPYLHVFHQTSPHVHLLEYGTADRYDNTRSNAYRGRIVANARWVPMAARNRQRFLVAAEALLQRPRAL